MSSFKRQPLSENVKNAGYQLYDLEKNDADLQEATQIDKDIYTSVVYGPKPYIPPVTEDTDLLDYYKDQDDIRDLYLNGQDIGERPQKRPASLDNVPQLSLQERMRMFRAIDIDVLFPNPDWSDYSYVNHAGLNRFFKENVDQLDIFPQLFGPFDGFEGRMSTVEFNIKQEKYQFDQFRPLIPYIGKALGLSAMWYQKHMETIHPRKDRHYQFYKAMVNIHCVFVKDYESTLEGDQGKQVPQREYRRFIFDSMCEDDRGTFLMARSPERLFKMVYNTFAKMAFEKLDGDATINVPFTDSRFVFYSIRSACVTVFQYEPARVGSYIPTPKSLSMRKAIINPKVSEDCFKYAVLTGILFANVTTDELAQFDNLNNKKVLDSLFEEYEIDADFSSVDDTIFRYDEKALDAFCEDNEDYFITVWVASDRSEDRIPVHPIYQSKRLSNTQKAIHLLLITKAPAGIDFFEDLVDGQQELIEQHFACIFNIDGLFYNSSGKHRVHLCPVCNIRRRIDTRGKGFCELHEHAQFQLALNNEYKNHADIRDAVIQDDPAVKKVFATLCPKCANNFECPSALKEHMEECLVRDKNYRIINLPKKREYLQLSGRDKIKLSMLHTFMVADFESVLSPLNEENGNQLMESEHLPCAYSLLMESDYEALCKFRTFIGTGPQNTIEDFCNMILEWSTEVYSYYQRNITMLPLTPEQKEEYDEATECYICGNPFLPAKGKRKVRDHDHLTGQFIGAACEGCNINRRPDRMYIPLFFHNGKNYDTHLLIKEITKAQYDCKFEGIAQNSQKIMSFKIMRFENEEQPDGSVVTTRSMCDIKVLDSILFLLSSLGKLTEVQKHKSQWNGDPMTEEAMGGYRDVFPITYRWSNLIYMPPYFDAAYVQSENYYDPRITLALRKNAYPYLWFNNFEKFSYPIGELTKLFDNRVYTAFTENVTSEFKANFEDNIGVYHKVIEVFNFQFVWEYVKLYVSMDVLQLADILQETRIVYQRVHRLDMFQFYGLPGYTWAAFQLHIDASPYKPWLFMEGEMDKVCFIARAIRGGCSGCMLRYSYVNNKFMEDKALFRPEKPHKYLLYLDANNLYGWSMSQDLPYGEFEWYSSERIVYFNGQEDNYECFIRDYLDELGDGRGAYIMCDLEFPWYIHDKLNFYPLAPESGYVPEEWISNYSRMLHELAGSKHDSKSRLLLQSLTKRVKYVTYYKNLRFYLRMGMKLTHIYKILEFKEAPLMRSYIDLNTQMRNKAESVAEKNQWKNANNSAYGKTFENQLNYSILKFISGEEAFNKAVKDPGFDGCVFASDNLMLGRMKYTSVDFNKPIYLGATITELAKLHMFEFYYDVLMDHFGQDNIKLCMTDTDSVLVEVQCEDIYEEIAKIQRKYDSPIDTSPLKPAVVEKYGIIGEHNKEVGYFKPEADPIAIQEFVGLRPKVYSTREMNTNDAHMRCKGTPKSSMEMFVRHQNYIECLFHDYQADRMRQRVDVSMIRSKDHHIYSIQTSKVSLSCNDSKRFILQDNIHSFAYGHYVIPHYIAYYERGEEPLVVPPQISDIPKKGQRYN